MIYTSWQFTCHLQADSSADPCSELYHGPSASSELEVQAITDYFWNNKPVIGAIDFHSYYQEILYPPGIQLVKLSLSLLLPRDSLSTRYTASKVITFTLTIYQEILYPPDIQLVKLSFRAVTIQSRRCDGQGACKGAWLTALFWGTKC